MKGIFRYLFPRSTTQQKLRQVTLLHRAISSDFGATKKSRAWEYELIKGYGLAKTDQDAQRLLDKHSGKDVYEVIRLARRQRKPKRLARAWKRFLKLWEV